MAYPNLSIDDAEFTLLEDGKTVRLEGWFKNLNMNVGLCAADYILWNMSRSKYLAFTSWERTIYGEDEFKKTRELVIPDDYKESELIAEIITFHEEPD